MSKIKIISSEDRGEYYLTVEMIESLTQDDQSELMDKLEGEIRSFLRSKGISVKDCFTGE